MANYLLPQTVTYADGSHVHFGIPGLRIERVTARAVHLLHLPTQGRLELREYHCGTPRSMRSRLRWETGSAEIPENLAFWYTAGITAAEESAAPHWAPTPCTPLRSRLMVRASTWWRHWPHTAEIVPARRSNTSRCLKWREGPSCTEVGDLLVNSAIRISDAANVSGPDGADVSLLTLGSATIELACPSQRGTSAGTGIALVLVNLRRLLKPGQAPRLAQDEPADRFGGSAWPADQPAPIRR
ncbi:hypothetical protein ACGF0D_17025 [Kitasatospora sp. NPDC048298]|uniref:hypothetical protein n=1 Tax=Kitasatospora sp. NPDC048298 TaxID=3364049 RepID=UPI003720879F